MNRESRISKWTGGGGRRSHGAEAGERGMAALAVILLAVAAFMLLSIVFEATGRLHRQNQALGREIQARAAALGGEPGKPPP